MFEKRKMALAGSMRANIEDVPDWKVRTPLQRSVQLLKRHRDIYFNGKDDKPISIIITTLAGHAYQNEADLFDAFFSIINGMTDPKNIKGQYGKYYIPNPTNPDENFADKWNEDENLPKAFLTWLGQLKTDVENAIEQSDSAGLKAALGPIFGTGVVGIAVERLVAAAPPNKSHPKVTFSSKPDKPWAN
jgi:hypothetical protein